MITQEELEREMYAFGRGRASRMMDRNEQAGRANNNPYAQAIYRRFVLPLAEAIEADVAGTGKAGRRKAHVKLLAPLDPEAAAYLAVRNTLNTLLNGTSRGDSAEGASSRAVVTAVGKAAYHELMLGLFENEDPALFHTLVNDFGRRMSKSERHRMTVFTMQARAKGITVPSWGAGGVEQVGAYLLDKLEALGMVETRHTHKATPRSKMKVKQSVEIRLTDDTLYLIEQIRDHIVETTPYFLPCIEPPKDWVSPSNGGFHTPEMRRLHPFAVRAYGGRDHLEQHDLSIPLAAINTLQRVAWQVNGRMLDAIRSVAQHFDMDEIISQAEFPSPPKPSWLTDGMKLEDMSGEEQGEFIAWKRAKAEWFTQMKLRGTKYGRFYTATSVADKFRDFPAIYFVYFADFRGRLYAQTTGVSPQGSDMQKALIRFAEGKPLSTTEAQRWFLIHGANKWGYDKASLDDRAKWSRERQELLCGFADDPVTNSEWRDADSPLQFLAWCQEFAAYVRAPDTFVSHIPIGMDGSCNGLQNFSAMLRDEVGGRATNLVPAALPSDIYQMVADVTAKLLAAAEPDELGYRDRWLTHGMNRTLVKRSVMTLPYGSTRFSCADFIVTDYLKQGKAREFDPAEFSRAAQYLSHFVWRAIADVVVKAREAMDWLQAAARVVVKRGNEYVSWVTPSGFPVRQAYYEQDSHRIRTNLCGNAFLRISVDKETPDVNRHKNGVAPNFIHSFDAAHLHRVTVAAGTLGLALAMIHDDYGTHAADAGILYRLIREQFVAMYESSSPLEEFAQRYNLPDPPAKGNLDLKAVLESPYFFS